MGGTHWTKTQWRKSLTAFERSRSIQDDAAGGPKRVCRERPASYLSHAGFLESQWGQDFPGVQKMSLQGADGDLEMRFEGRD